MTISKSIIFVANRGYALTNSRAEILQYFISSGWKVVVVTADDNEANLLIKMGVILEPIKFQRGGLSIFNDINTYFHLLKIYLKWQPNIIHHFHAKPVILGTIAAHRGLSDSTKIVNTITGMHMTERQKRSKTGKTQFK